jgi:hypothetical protein
MTTHSTKERSSRLVEVSVGCVTENARLNGSREIGSVFE